MKIPPSSHFTPISLKESFNLDRQNLPAALQAAEDVETAFGLQAFRGIPFELGQPAQANVILLAEDEVNIDVGGIRATYLLFLHAVADRVPDFQAGLGDFEGNIPRGGDMLGNELGQVVSDYSLAYTDGKTASRPIVRRLAIQQRHVSWGASPFAAVHAHKPFINPTTTEEQILGRVPQLSSGRGELRHRSARDLCQSHLWLYALPNPHPEKPIHRIVCMPREERSAIYAISYTNLEDHPLRPGLRRKLRLKLPNGHGLNALSETEDIDIDLGMVISARAALNYDRERWFGSEPDVQPVQAEDEVIVEYASHPRAKLYIATTAGSLDSEQPFEVFDLWQAARAGTVSVNPANRPVKLRVVERGSKQPVAVRLHLHGEAGEYLPPRGHHRKVNPHWFEDNYAEFVNDLNQYCYISGECVADLPLGEVFVEINRGYEVAPLRSSFQVTSESDEIIFELDRVLDWRQHGWVTADTHIHFLSPQTALLEGSAEGVNVVNLLASQWGEMFSNVGDFDGKSTLGAKEFGGDGEFLVRVGTENRMQVLGHISLLGYSGPMIDPLCSGGPSESAIGDPQELTMAEWARRCIDQNGLVVMPHAPNPQGERAADIVLGLVHAIEMMTFNPFNAQISPYGLADWYRYLNLGYQLPVVGGSDKMSAASLLGGVRTYTHLGDRPFTYENWMAAVQAGHTFVTVGPLVDLSVEGLSPGNTLNMPASGGTVTVSWKVESVRLPIERIEVVVGGLTAEQVDVGNVLSAEGSVELKIADSTWIALRVRGSLNNRNGEIAAHTSAVRVLVEGKPLFSKRDSHAILGQIEGAIAYVDTIAPRPEAKHFKQLRATLEAAHNRLHQQMHRHGVYHDHTPLHDHARSREH